MSELTRARLDDTLGLVLTDEQWEVVSSPVTPAVIVAGAGSGKTTSMAARVAWLVGSGHVRPDGVLGLTFTTKAAAQLLGAMRTSVARLVDAGLVEAVVQDDESLDESPEVSLDVPLGEPEVLTYHAFAARILAEHGIRIGREPDAAVLTDEARRQLAYRLVCRSTAPLSEVGRSPVTVASDLLKLDDELTELGIEPQVLRDFDAALIERLRAHDSEKPLQVIGRTMLQTSTARQVLATLVDDWRAEKAARDVVDFADQIRLAGEIVARFPDVAADLRARYPVVLLDEYQDTSIAQRQLLQAVFSQAHPVLAVGDPCQAIYGWRGASVDNIESFPQHFPSNAGPADRYALSMNRRSGPAVLEVANRSAERVRSVHSGVRPLRAGDNGKGQGRVSCALFETYGQEVDWLVGEIIATHASAPWRDIAVLAATARDLVAVEQALRQRGVPTQLVGAAALLAQPAVIDLRSMLEVIHDPCANPAFVRLAAGPRWRIGAADLAALGERAAALAGGRGRTSHADLATALDEAVAGTDPTEAVSLTDALIDPGDADQYSAEAYERFALMAAELAGLRREVGSSLPELVLHVMRVTGLEAEAALADPQGQQVQALHGLVDLAASFNDLDGRVGLGAFLSRLRDSDRFEAGLDLDVPIREDAVRLLTIHRAKGLEFPYVFVPFVSDGSFPGGHGRPAWTTRAIAVPWPLRHDATAALRAFPRADEAPRAKDHDAYLDTLRFVSDLEDDRLAYVAFTRAERGLAVSGHWWGPRQRTRRGPSRFLQSVHESCLDGLGDVVHWAPEPDDDARNPMLDESSAPRVWPVPPDDRSIDRLRAAASSVRTASPWQATLPGTESDDLSRLLADWDDRMVALLEEQRQRRATDHVVRLPRAVSVTTLLRALADPEATARDLARPMPRQPSGAARRGTRFHAWVEARYGQQSLLDPEDLPGAADEGIADEAALAELMAAFESSVYADRAPVGVEVPFTVMLHGRVVSGRIDAVFRADPKECPGALFEVVDWKTGRAASVDPGQLAVYRLAWSQIAQVPIEQVAASFLIVATGEVLRPETDGLLSALG